MLLTHYRKVGRYTTILVIAIILAITFLNRSKLKRVNGTFTYSGKISSTKSVIQRCVKQLTLQEHLQKVLACRNSATTRILTDVPILNETGYNGKLTQFLSVINMSYFVTKPFLAFRTLHKSARYPLFVYSLGTFTYGVRVPIFDTLSAPYNKSELSYAIPLPISHVSQKDITPYKYFTNKTYYIGKSKAFEAAFIVASNAVAHSYEGDVLVQTCCSTIFFFGCPVPKSNLRLQSIFPVHTDTNICTKNTNDSRMSIISVDKLVVIDHVFYEDYYHLTIEAMSRLMILHELLLFDPEVFVLIQYSRYQNNAQQLLNHFGIETKRILFYSLTSAKSTLFRANVMFVPRGMRCGEVAPSLVERVRIKSLSILNNRTAKLTPHFLRPLPVVFNGRINASLSKLPVTRVKTGPIIFIYRDTKRGRNLADNKVLITFLREKYSMVPLVLFHGNVSLLQTMKLFQSARVVVAPHGAGQANALWMRPGTAMLEISPQMEYNLCYHILSYYLEIEFYLYTDRNATRSVPLQVNMTIFSELFGKLMQGRF